MPRAKGVQIVHDAPLRGSGWVCHAMRAGAPGGCAGDRDREGVVAMPDAILLIHKLVRSVPFGL